MVLVRCTALIFALHPPITNPGNLLACKEIIRLCSVFIAHQNQLQNQARKSNYRVVFSNIQCQKLNI